MWYLSCMIPFIFDMHIVYYALFFIYVEIYTYNSMNLYIDKKGTNFQNTRND